ncbi:aminotransferase class I/II-fold pyridoxal phosphate-dependent enzyme [Nonlabens tegetincola]|uniref:pyridoxal phosphate-dependent aminotransferase n=1 Tax=Nonlabens tegetincola TaxID=323273 RepID=UPI0030C7B937
MTFNLKDIVRKNIWDLKPYSSARSEFDLYNSGKNKLTLLDANENPQGQLNRYPDPLQLELKKELAYQKKLSIDQIFVGNGSDEAIDLLYRIFCNPGKDKTLILPPTYGMYEVSAGINDIEVLKAPLNSAFEIDFDAVNNQITNNENLKIIWICSPNNPTGNAILKADLKHDWQAQNYTKGGMMDLPFNPAFENEMQENQVRLDKLFNNFKGIIVVDEAYQDFTENISFINRLQDYPNLVVLQTMSKAQGLAAARVGFAFASKEIIELFNKTKPPYNVNELSQKAALSAIRNVEQAQKSITTLNANRKWLSEQLDTFDFINKVFPSEANFILASVKNANHVYNYLRDQGIIIRNRSSQIENTLRFTVGTMQECEEMVLALNNYQKQVQ